MGDWGPAAHGGGWVTGGRLSVEEGDWGGVTWRRVGDRGPAVHGGG